MTFLRSDERRHAIYQLRSELRRRRGENVAVSLYETDYTRYLPIASYWINRYMSGQEFEVEFAVDLAGYVQARHLAPQISKMLYDHTYVNVAAKALGEMKAVEAIPRMAEVLGASRWPLIQMGEPAVPTLATLVRQTQTLEDAGRSELIVRAYLDHWDELPQGVPPEIVDATKEALESLEARGGMFRSEYHRELLERVDGGGP